MKKFVDNYIIILLKSYTKRTQLPNLKDADTLFHWCEQPCDYQNLAKRPMKTKSVLYAMANGVIKKPKKKKKIKPPRPGNLINCSWSSWFLGVQDKLQTKAASIDLLSAIIDSICRPYTNPFAKAKPKRQGIFLHFPIGEAALLCCCGHRSKETF